MKYIAHLGAVAALAAFTACSSTQSSPSGNFNPASATLNTHQQPTKMVTRKRTPTTLYVLDDENGTDAVRVYRNGGASFLRSVQPESYGAPVTYAVDAAGTLYVAAFNEQAKRNKRGVLYEYTSRGSKLVRTLLQRTEFGFLTSDEDGNLYSICPGPRVCEFPGGNEPASRKLKGVSGPLATDASGDLAVGLCGAEACVFAPGQQSAYWDITSGVDRNYMNGFAFDPQGNLYADNQGVGSSVYPGDIAVFAPTESSPSRIITTGVAGPLAIVTDEQGNLYVYNQCAGSYNSQHQCSTPGGAVTVYAPGASTPFRTITTGVLGIYPHLGQTGSSQTLAVDNSGNIYVVNGGPNGGGNVTVYKPGVDRPVRTVRDVEAPLSVTVGP